MSFWIGMLVGAMIGTPVGVIILATLILGADRRDSQRAYRAHRDETPLTMRDRLP